MRRHQRLFRVLSQMGLGMLLFLSAVLSYYGWDVRVARQDTDFEITPRCG